MAAVSIRSRLFALVYDRQMAAVELAGLSARREALLSPARGHVLEIGAGTGANLPFYGPAVESLTLTEPELSMLRRLAVRAAELAPQATVVRAAAETLPFADSSFDVAVSTLVLCGVRDQPGALRELRRVLRPGGSLIFIEHVRANDPRLARRQDRLNRLNRFVAGCECNRPTLASIRAEGFDVTEVEHSNLGRAPSFVRPLIAGVATSGSYFSITKL